MADVITQLLRDYGKEDDFRSIESHQFILEEKIKSVMEEIKLQECLHLGIHYYSPKYAPSLKNRLRLKLHTDRSLESLKSRYDSLLNLYDSEDEHLCCAMIKRREGRTFIFRISETNLNDLKEIANRIDLDEDNKILKKSKLIMKELTEYFSHQQQYVSKFDNTKVGKNSKRGEILATSLLFTFLASGKILLEHGKYIDIVFCPISLSWQGVDDVIAVLVGIFNNRTNELLPLEFIKDPLTLMIHGIHHRELLFDFHEKSPINEERKKLLSEIDDVNKEILEIEELFNKKRTERTQGGKEEQLANAEITLNSLKIMYQAIKNDIKVFVGSERIADIREDIKSLKKTCENAKKTFQ